MLHTATHCNTLQHTATLCNTLQRTATRCNALQHAATHCNTLQHIATHCNTLKYATTHYDTLQHTATHCNKLQRPCTGALKGICTRGARVCITLQTLHRTVTHIITLQKGVADCSAVLFLEVRITGCSQDAGYTEKLAQKMAKIDFCDG